MCLGIRTQQSSLHYFLIVHVLPGLNIATGKKLTRGKSSMAQIPAKEYQGSLFRMSGKDNLPGNVTSALDTIDNYIKSCHMASTRTSRPKALILLGRELVKLMSRTYLAGSPVFERGNQHLDKLD